MDLKRNEKQQQKIQPALQLVTENKNWTLRT